MAIRAQELASLAVARARSLMPGLAPDSVQVVELTRGRAFVVVRSHPAGIVVLDRSGRLVRSRERLAAIGRHVRSQALLDVALKEARLEARREHAERSIAFLKKAGAACRARKTGEGVAAVVAALEALARAIDEIAAQADRGRQAPPTVRTLRRTVMLLNEGAAADRAVVREARRLAGVLAAPRRGNGSRAAEERLQRWIVARLTGADLRYFHPELEEEETARFVGDFVATVRAEVVGAAE